MEHVVLGGELRGRGIFSGNHSPLEWAGMAGFTAIGIITVLVGGATWGAAIAGAALIGLGIGGFTPWSALLGRSGAGWVVLWVRRRWICRKNRAVFTPVDRGL